MTRIAVFGASGFIGATFVEHLLATGGHEVRPVIHSTGNAWRLSRHGVPLHSVDLLDEKGVHAAIDGCTHVVNCTLGSKPVMFKGLRNLLTASRSAGIQRFVHLSSVSVYGDQTPGTLIDEGAEPRPAKGLYGWVKLRQDKMVQAACRRGLPCVLLHPPNISGAYSRRLLKVLNTMREGRLALVDHGKAPCSLVDVQDLARAIELALFCRRADSVRIFVTDCEQTTWRDLVDALAPLADSAVPVPSLTREEATPLQNPASNQISVQRSLKLLAAQLTSQDFQRLIDQDPLLRKGLQFTRRVVGMLPKSIKGRLRRRVGERKPVGNVISGPPYDPELCAVQLRAVRYSCERAREILGYEPAYSFARSIEVFRSWYQTTHGWGSADWPLLAQL